MGIGCLLIVVPLGGILGLIAGYWNGKFISNFIMRLADVFLALPALILVMCVSSIMEASLSNAMLALSVSWWPWYTRLVYGIVVSTRNETYIRSAEVLGAAGLTYFREILPQHIIADIDQSNSGHGLGCNGRRNAQLCGNGRAAANAFTGLYGKQRN